jgi:hypothetical protein
VRHAPHVDSPGHADHADVDDQRVRAFGVSAPVPAVTKDGQPAGVDVDASGHVDVDVRERRQHRHRPRPVHAGLPQQIACHPRGQRRVDTLTELFKGQTAGDKMLAKRFDRPLAVGV